MNFNPYHDETLEAIARKIIQQYDPSLLYRPAAIPVEDIIEKVYGLTLEFHYIRKNGRVLGETVFKDAMVPVYDREKGEYTVVFVKGGTILIDAALISNRGYGCYFFTCSHELSHWVIDRKYFTDLGTTAALSVKPVRSSETEQAIERQCNRLACRILMPKCTVKMAFHDNFNKPNIVDYMAKLYNVSNKSMEIRLGELGLLYR
jgi:hypothetical protein